MREGSFRKAEVGEALIAGLTLAVDGIRRTAALMCGFPDYEAYVAHCLKVHPEVPPLSRQEFVRHRMNARFGRGRVGCC